MATLPFAVSGGFWLMWLLGYNLSVASAIGFIALAGVSAEFGVVMLLFLKQAIEKRGRAAGVTASGATALDAPTLDAAIEAGAVLRVRPKTMTIAVIVAGLIPVMLSTGTGSEIMQRIAAPMVGGMLTAPLLSMFVIPAAVKLMRRRKAANAGAIATAAGSAA